MALCALAMLCACARAPRHAADGRLVIEYWEKWTGIEAEAMQRVVDRFNASQDRYLVEMTIVSAMERKLVAAVANGVPPDVCGAWTHIVPTLAEKGAVEDLTGRFAAAGFTRERFLPFVWDLMSHDGRVWGMITTPASLALHYNTRLFREAGLDPHRPPRTPDELLAYADRLTVYRDPATGATVTYAALLVEAGTTEAAARRIAARSLDLVQAGFVPTEPGWWQWFWGYFFGGTMFESPDRVTASDPRTVRAYRWVQSFITRYGPYNVRKFSSGFGQFASPQNAFLSGKTAMVIQGVWMANFINRYAPGLQWAAAPFPTEDPRHYGMSMVEGDMLFIPKGSRHPEAAMEFISFVARQDMMELLNLGQWKFSPLAEVSEEFYRRHPNPFIRLFRALAESPHAFAQPRTGVWNEYLRDCEEAFSRIWFGLEDPEPVLEEIAGRNQRLVERNRELLRLRGKLP